MLYGRHLGFKGNFEKLLAERDRQGARTVPRGGRREEEAAKFMKIRAVWQFFEAERDGNAIHLFAPGASEPVHTFQLRPPAEIRRPVPERLHSGWRGGAPRSSRAVRGNGGRVRAVACRKRPSRRGEFLLAHALQALAIETAEGCAEWLHRRIREDWGFPDPPTMTMQERFTSRYRGKRYSFGYPACPNLEDQAGHVEAVEAGRYRRAAHRGHDDGPGGERQRAGVPSSGLRVFHGE